ncbi:MAG: hypothetical protein GTN92_21550, partial [Pseudomonas stutzeri]|nr:hypothetical protein [Stutzerimonas stutzeri]
TYRRTYLEALLLGHELPELPDAWHQLSPGTHTAPMAQDEPDPVPSRSLPRTIAVVLAVAALAVGALIVLVDFS